MTREPWFQAPLEREMRGGVEHFKPGQHSAVIVPDCVDAQSGEPFDLGRISYVDVTGHHCVVLTKRENGGPWEPTWIGRVGQVTADGTRRPPEGWTLSEKMLAALAAAPSVTFEQLEAGRGLDKDAPEGRREVTT